MAVPRGVLVERGHVPAREPDPPWTEEAIRGLLAAAGFETATVEEQEVAYRFAGADELWLYVSELLGPVAAAVARLDDGERHAVRAEIEAATPPDGAGFVLPGLSLNVLATVRA
jgi:hypothetical protein